MSTEFNKRRGFAIMKALDPAKQQRIARHGGLAAHESGNAHEWDSAEARIAGKLGGLAVLDKHGSEHFRMLAQRSAASRRARKAAGLAKARAMRAGRLD